MYPKFFIKKDVRRCFIAKHNAMYFRIIENKVEIITILDTRENLKSIEL